VVGQGLAEGSDLLPDVPQGLNTTPVVAGLRVRLQPKSKSTYELLCKVLREESGFDLEKEIAEEERRANDRLAIVHEHRRPTDDERNKGNIVTFTKGRGNSRAYIVGRLKREAAKAKDKDPLFLDPKIKLAAELWPRVEANEVSAYAASLEMGWQQRPRPADPYKQLVTWWDKADSGQRCSFLAYLDACRRRPYRGRITRRMTLAGDARSSRPRRAGPRRAAAGEWRRARARAADRRGTFRRATRRP
jgi:hypothetical protein